jgi:hypothetical protein
MQDMMRRHEQMMAEMKTGRCQARCPRPGKARIEHEDFRSASGALS